MNRYQNFPELGYNGAQNAAALPEPKIPSPQALRKKKEEAFAFEVDCLRRLLRKATVEAMTSGKLSTTVSFAETAADVRNAVVQKLQEEIRAAGWEDPHVSHRSSSASISWREPPTVAEAP